MCSSSADREQIAVTADGAPELGDRAAVDSGHRVNVVVGFIHVFQGTGQEGAGQVFPAAQKRRRSRRFFSSRSPHQRPHGPFPQPLNPNP